MTTQETIKKLNDMINAGASNMEVAEKLGLSQNRVAYYVRQGRMSGKITSRRPIKNVDAIKFLQNSYMRLGTVSEIVSDLTQDQIEWIIEQTKDLNCETIAEFITELVRDAHAEATEDTTHGI